ncbi:hypothetical protein AAMO2058_001123500 [Amorphochlora amoebiformis]|uniref:AAA+ ATPase domain-containing protein n=1 Tax=Amorphochlora amoebiformis TaxID=1561963 RepID=A0A7S0DKR6_9EUKA
MPHANQPLLHAPRPRMRRWRTLTALVCVALVVMLLLPDHRHDTQLGGGRQSKNRFPKKDPDGSLWQQTLRFLTRPTTIAILGALYLALRPVADTQMQPMIELPYSSFLEAIELGNKTHPAVDNVLVGADRWTFELNGIPAETTPVHFMDGDLQYKLKSKGITFMARDQIPSVEGFSLLLQILGLVATILLETKGGTFGGGSMGLEKVGQRVHTNETHFRDLKGMDPPKREVAEIVTMLKNPKKFLEAGVRLPSGVLLVGPPGTGKTMLARALAAEAGVPFFATSGADFVEVFAGRGAARVRSLFKSAMKAAPSVIFIDELDALGKARSGMRLGASDETEQTLNMLLASMDGLTTKNNGVIVIGATNRIDVLDPALIRPGRFDRIVKVERPDRDGRLDILKHYTRRLHLHPYVSLGKLADETQGFAGADLELLVNEAAIRSVRRNSTMAEEIDFNGALSNYQESRNKKSLEQSQPRLNTMEDLLDQVAQPSQRRQTTDDDNMDTLGRLQRMINDMRYFGMGSDIDEGMRRSRISGPVGNNNQPNPSGVNAGGGGWLLQKMFGGGGSPEDRPKKLESPQEMK